MSVDGHVLVRHKAPDERNVFKVFTAGVEDVRGETAHVRDEKLSKEEEKHESYDSVDDVQTENTTRTMTISRRHQNTIQ